MFLIYDEFFWQRLAWPHSGGVIFILASLELCLFSLTGLLAIWGGLGRPHWFVRAVVVLGGLSLWLFVPAYEPMLVFFAQTAVASLLLSSGKCWRGRTQPRRFPQFSLRDMLLWTVVVAAVSAAAAQVTADVWHNGWKYLLHGSVYGLLTALVAWVALGRSRWWLRAIGGCMAFPSAIMVGWMLLGRWCGMFGGKPPARATLRYAARVGLVAVSLLIVLPSAFLYCRLVTPAPIPVVELPEPNGYDDLIRAGRYFVNVTVPERGVGIDALRAFVQDYASAMQIARKGLDRECQVPPRYGPADLWIGQLQNNRNLSRAFSADAFLAEAEGRTEDALRSQYDNLRLGTAAARGGLQADRLVGLSIHGMAVWGLSDLSDGLSPQQCAEVIDVLETSQSDWEPLEACWPREDVWIDHSSGWRGRFWITMELIRHMRSMEEQRAEYRANDHDIERGYKARVRLLIGKLVIRCYRLERGELPGSLADLVPEYLPEVPQDPFSGKALIYRRDGNDYVLYSVGRDRVDDGGKRAESKEESFSDKDILLYTWPDDAADPTSGEPDG